MRTQVKWVEYKELSDIQKNSVKFRYKPKYTEYKYRTYQGQLTMTHNDRRKK